MCLIELCKNNAKRKKRENSKLLTLSKSPKLGIRKKWNYINSYDFFKHKVLLASYTIKINLMSTRGQLDCSVSGLCESPFLWILWFLAKQSPRSQLCYPWVYHRAKPWRRTLLFFLPSGFQTEEKGFPLCLQEVGKEEKNYFECSKIIKNPQASHLCFFWSEVSREISLRKQLTSVIC